MVLQGKFPTIPQLNVSFAASDELSTILLSPAISVAVGSQFKSGNPYNLSERVVE
jgi:hypothetical protein